jgi:DNA-binding NarL/FixJ family response regulator
MEIKICIVDDHPIVVEGLRTLLNTVDGFQVVLCTTCGETLLSGLKQQDQLPDVILMDINLPDISGIELCKQIRDLYRHISVIGISMHNEISFITNMLNAGASGYLLKNADKEELISAIQTVLNHKKYLSREVLSLLAEAKLNESATPNLTQREKEIIRLLAEGFTTSKISKSLFISELTVETHRKNILRKFNVNNTTSMLKIAKDLQLI